MSSTLRKVAVIAGAVALVAVTVGAAAGALAPAALAGSAGVAGVSAATLTSIATYASIASGIASIGAQVTAKKPPARGTINQVMIAAEPVAPYIIGRTYSGGVLRHDVGYGATLKKVPNPYRGMVIVYSAAGPCQALEGIYLDYTQVPVSGDAATGYYAGFLYRDYRRGLFSETALTPNWSGMPNWSAAHKLSSKAAILWNAKFDKDGKRFASGFPASGAVWQGVMTYDARQDSTYPGGAGAHRINDEGTWTYSECPGRHALAYVLGRFRNGKKVFGVGLPADGIIVQDFVTLSNICDANGWKVGGVIYEPGDRWANLKRILEAGAAEPLWRGGKLGLRFNAPRISLYTVTDADLADDDGEVTAMQPWAQRLNGIRPKYRSEANKWEYVQSDLVSIPGFLAEDGEPKIEEQQFDLVQWGDQAAQLAAYRLLNGRELAPIILRFKPHMRQFGPGDMLTFDLPEHGLVGVDAIIMKRDPDAARMVWTMTFMSESPGKHDFALGRTGTAPPTPALSTGEERDDIATEVGKGSNGFTVAPAATSLSIAANASGVVKSGQLPRTVIFQLLQGTDDVSEDPDTTYVLSSSGITAAMGGTNGRELTISSLIANEGQASVTVRRNGVDVAISTVTLTKVRDGAAAGAQTDTTISIRNANTYVHSNGGPLTRTMAAGDFISLSVNLPYVASSGSGSLAGKFTYRTPPGSGAWIDVDDEVQDEAFAAVGEPSLLSFSASMSAPSAGDYEFDFINRRYSGAGTLAVSGDASFSIS